MAIGIFFSSSCEYIRSTNSFSANSVEYFALNPYQYYVLELRERLESTCKLAHDDIQKP